METIKYSSEILRSFNKKGIYPINPDLLIFFSRFKKSTLPYNNPFNDNFPVQNRKKLFPTLEPFSDEKILSELKTQLLKLTEDNNDAITDKILQMHFPKGIEDKVAYTFYETIITCIFLVESYVTLLLKLENKYNEIVLGVNKIIRNQLYNPKKFSSENDVISCESAIQKEKKWRLNNALLIAELYKKNKYHHNFIYNNILLLLVNQISLSDTINIEVLKNICPIVLPILTKEKIDMKEFYSKLRIISQNNEYPTRLRYLVMDIIE